MKRAAFNKDELKARYYDPPFMPGLPPSKVRNTPVSSKENLTALYRREMPLWIPQFGELQMMTPRIDPDNIARAFCFEANPLSPEEMVGGKDKFGIDWVYVPIAGGSMVKPGSPAMEDANDWESVIHFPDVDAWDWEGTKTANADFMKPDRFVMVTILTGFFERLISFMDFENAALALIDDEQKQAVHTLFDKVTDVYLRMVDKYIECYHLDILCIHDDWGAQRAPFFSLDTVMEMIVPHLQKLVNGCHARGLFVDMHSCGKNELLVPGYIAAGCDSWSGQTMNDKDMLYEKYGDKIILGLDPDIEFGPDTTDEEAAASARRFVAKYGKTMESKPFLCSGFGQTEAFSDTLYEESRKLFG